MSENDIHEKKFTKNDNMSTKLIVLIQRFQFLKPQQDASILHNKIYLDETYASKGCRQQKTVHLVTLVLPRWQ